jgi:hypothetical protein
MHKPERDADLLCVCEALRREAGGYIAITRLAGLAIRRSAGSFYLSERKYTDIITRRALTPKSPLKREMHADILALADRLRSAHPQAGTRAIVRMAAAQGAPRFYLSGRRAADILYASLKTKR